LDWVKIPQLNENEWQQLLLKLTQNQNSLIEIIKEKAEKQFENKVGNRTYNFRLLLNGIIQHDIYHIGQISIVRKLI
jgi:uncharacterized damage-inducible protein DinB